MRRVGKFWNAPLVLSFAVGVLIGLIVLCGVSMAALADPVLTRGPYLQRTTMYQTTFRWRTDIDSDSEVRYGFSPDALDKVAQDPTQTREHNLTVGGLTPATRYYYSVGSTSKVLAGGDADHFVITAPPVGSTPAVRVWIIGDSGTGGSSQRAVRDAYLNFTGARTTDVWLMLGDNAYDSGTDSQYQSKFFEIYPMLLRQATVWPTLGNHDARSADSDTQTGVYYDIFSLPKNGEAGGIASGTEAYYSFDYANIHFVCLDSEDTDTHVGSPMYVWTEKDLAAAQQEWVIAFWHHPPYSKGSHDSDDEGSLREMRERFLPLFEDYGVDFVFCGHSHSYERSFLLDRHYGKSDTLDESMILDHGDGRPGGDGAYVKSDVPHSGCVYVVAGSSGQTSGGSLDHPAMFISLNKLGSVVLDIQGPNLNAMFLRETQNKDDFFRVEQRDLALSVFPRHVVAGNKLKFTTMQSNPGDAALLLLVGSGPKDFVFAVGSYDASGRWIHFETVPPGLAGLDLTFQSAGITLDGQLVTTNTEDVRFE